MSRPKYFWHGPLCAVLLTFCSCAPLPRLDPNPRPMGIIERLERANLVVMGVVQSETTAQGGWRPTNSGSMPLELQMVRFRVEGVIKGRYESAALSFYYYRSTGGWTGHAPNIVLPGRRYIMYLLKDGDLLRATNDAYSSNTEIITGRHKLEAVVDREASLELIARLLLLPGDGLDVSQYLESFYVERETALGIVGPIKTAELLRSLLRDKNGLIRGRACIELAEFPIGDKACLAQLLGDLSASPEDRERGRSLSQGR